MNKRYYERNTVKRKTRKFVIGDRVLIKCAGHISMGNPYGSAIILPISTHLIGKIATVIEFSDCRKSVALRIGKQKQAWFDLDWLDIVPKSTKTWIN